MTRESYFFRNFHKKCIGKRKQERKQRFYPRKKYFNQEQIVILPAKPIRFYPGIILDFLLFRWFFVSDFCHSQAPDCSTTGKRTSTPSPWPSAVAACAQARLGLETMRKTFFFFFLKWVLFCLFFVFLGLFFSFCCCFSLFLGLCLYVFFFCEEKEQKHMIIQTIASKHQQENPSIWKLTRSRYPSQRYL